MKSNNFSFSNIVSFCLLLISLTAAFFAVSRTFRVKAVARAEANASVGVQTRYVTKSIEDINVGDEVLAYDVASGQTVISKVAEAFNLKCDHLRVLCVEDEKGVRQTLKTTDAHPFWVVDSASDLSRQADVFCVEHDVATDSDFLLERSNLAGNDDGYYVEAKDLQIGDRFLSPNGESTVLIASVRDEHPEGVEVYNFKVVDNNNYFVISDCFNLHDYLSPLLVHNAECGGYLQGDQDYVSTTSGYHKTKVPRPPRHHAFPQQYREWFEKRKVNIDDYTLELNQGEHSAIHTFVRMSGDNAQGWNEAIMEELFLKEKRKRSGRLLTPREIIKLGKDFKQRYGFGDYGFIKYHD